MMRLLKGIHWPTVTVMLIISGVSFFAIYSATYREYGHYFIYRQLMWLGVAFVLFWITVAIGYRSLLNVSYMIYSFSLLLLVFVLAFGVIRQGAQRWIAIGSFVLQPSEFCRLATMFVLAQFLAERARRLGQKRSFAMGAFLVMIPFILILKQPDLGSALLFIPILLAMLFVWGVRIRYLIGVFFMGLASLPFAWFSLKTYQQKRLLVFLNPNADPLGSGYTALQSKIAVGSGCLLGKGWLHGTQTQLQFVPEHHTDFIFCVIGEEFGFAGCAFLILLFCLMVGYALHIMDRTTDQRARILAAGIAAMIFFQVMINIGMTIGLAPITGITLPLVSYGGSSLIATYMALGILVSIHKERSIF